MSDRPAIPVEIAEEVLFECRYLCANDCVPVALERCHIIPWSESQDHSVENLVVLCANCHTRSHAEKWPASRLKRIKERPCALERDRMPPMSTEQKVLVEAILSCEPEALDDRQRVRLLKMLAAFLEIDINKISIVKVEPTNSSRVTIIMPTTAAGKLNSAVEQGDQRLVEIIGHFPARIASVRILPSLMPEMITDEVSEWEVSILPSVLTSMSIAMLTHVLAQRIVSAPWLVAIGVCAVSVLAIDLIGRLIGRRTRRRISYKHVVATLLAATFTLLVVLSFLSAGEADRNLKDIVVMTVFLCLNLIHQVLFSVRRLGRPKSPVVTVNKQADE